MNELGSFQSVYSNICKSNPFDINILNVRCSNYPIYFEIIINENNIDALNNLFDRNIDIDYYMKDSIYQHFLILCIKLEASKEFIKAVLDHGMDPNGCDMYGCNSLVYALSKAFAYPDIIELLISYGVNVNAKDMNGVNAVIYNMNRSEYETESYYMPRTLSDVKSTMATFQTVGGDMTSTDRLNKFNISRNWHRSSFGFYSTPISIESILKISTSPHIRVQYKCQTVLENHIEFLYDLTGVIQHAQSIIDIMIFECDIPYSYELQCELLSAILEKDNYYNRKKLTQCLNICYNINKIYNDPQYDVDNIITRINNDKIDINSPFGLQIISNTIIRIINENDINSLQKLISAGLDLTQYSFITNLIISSSIATNNINMMKFLVSVGVNDFNRFNNRGELFLVSAVRNHNTEMVEFLLKHNADPNGVDTPNINNVPMLMINYYTTPDIIELLCKYGADVNVKYESQFSPLFYCVSYRFVNLDIIDIIKILVKYNADIADPLIRPFYIDLILNHIEMNLTAESEKVDSYVFNNIISLNVKIGIDLFKIVDRYDYKYNITGIVDYLLLKSNIIDYNELIDNSYTILDYFILSYNYASENYYRLINGLISLNAKYELLKTINPHIMRLCYADKCSNNDICKFLLSIRPDIIDDETIKIIIKLYTRSNEKHYIDGIKQQLLIILNRQ